MKIDRISNAYKNIPTNKQSKINNNKVQNKIDTSNISTIGKDLSYAKQVLNNIPDVRNEKIKPLKEQIKNETYNISIDDFTNKLLNNPHYI